MGLKIDKIIIFTWFMPKQMENFQNFVTFNVEGIPHALLEGGNHLSPPWSNLKKISKIWNLPLEIMDVFGWLEFIACSGSNILQ